MDSLLPVVLPAREPRDRRGPPVDAPNAACVRAVGGLRLRLAGHHSRIHARRPHRRPPKLPLLALPGSHCAQRRQCAAANLTVGPAFHHHHLLPHGRSHPDLNRQTRGRDPGCQNSQPGCDQTRRSPPSHLPSWPERPSQPCPVPTNTPAAHELPLLPQNLPPPATAEPSSSTATNAPGRQI